MSSRITPFHTKTSASLSIRKKRIYTFLYQQYVGVLSTVTPDGDPHGVVVYYVVDENLSLHIMTKKHTRKYDNLKHHNHVMLTVYDSRNQSTAQIIGQAIEHDDAKQISAVCNRIFKKLASAHDNVLPPIAKLQAGPFTTFTIEPAQIRMAVFSRPDPAEYYELFASIESFELHG